MAQPAAFLQTIIIGGPSHESSRRTFRCPRGHGYVADLPVTISAYGITPKPFTVCPACIVQLFVECCGAVEDAPPPPPPMVQPQIAPTILPTDYKGPAPMSFAELRAARARAQGIEVPVIPPQKVVQLPAETVSDAPSAPSEGESETD